MKILFNLLAKMTGGPSISKQGARSLILWSYLSGPDPSLLAPYIYPLWTAGASYLPMKWSPNLVTITGFTLILILYGVVWHQCGIDCAQQDEYEQFAYWLYPLAAALIWGYQTADAMDGRQGKRVGMYVHPSTELFDHGVDGVVTSISGITSVALLGLGSEYWGVLHLCCLWSMFYLTTHEHLTHGKITFSAGASNPTEGLVGVVVTFIALGLYPRFLETVVFDVPYHLKLKHCLVLSELATVVLTMTKNMSRMVLETDYLRPNMSFRTAVTYYLPLATTWVMAHFLLQDIGPDRSIFVGLSSCVNLAILQLIICEMTKSHFPSVAFAVSYLPGFCAVFVYGQVAVPYVVTVGLVRFAGRWLNFQRELVHYCGMAGPMSVQVWPEDRPNEKRLNDKIVWLVDPTMDISKGTDVKRNELLIKRKHVELLE